MTEIPSIVPLDENTKVDERGHQVLGNQPIAGIYLPEMYDHGEIVHVYNSSSCAMCGEYPTWRRDGDGTVYVNMDHCLFSSGAETVFELTVRSGKVVVDDDLRPVYDVDTDYFPSYNSALGQRLYCEAMARQGVAYGPVLNTSPSLYRTGEDTYVIGNPGWDPDTGEEMASLGEELAGVCTDLWAYMIADHDDFVARGGVIESPMRSVIDFPNGVYEFVHHTSLRGFDHHAEGPVIFAHIRRLADA